MEKKPVNAQNFEKKEHGYYLNPLCFVVVCYMAIDNEILYYITKSQHLEVKSKWINDNWLTREQEIKT